jgi:hypothetical protein
MTDEIDDLPNIKTLECGCKICPKSTIISLVTKCNKIDMMYEFCSLYETITLYALYIYNQNSYFKKKICESCEYLHCDKNCCRCLYLEFICWPVHETNICWHQCKCSECELLHKNFLQKFVNCCNYIVLISGDTKKKFLEYISTKS